MRAGAFNVSRVFLLRKIRKTISFWKNCFSTLKGYTNAATNNFLADQVHVTGQM